MLRRSLLFGVSVFILAAGFMLPKIAARLGKLNQQHEGRQDAWESRLQQKQPAGVDQPAAPAPSEPVSTAETANTTAGGKQQHYWLIAAVGLVSALALGGMAYAALK